jgi:hypothetical protein
VGGVNDQGLLDEEDILIYLGICLLVVNSPVELTYLLELMDEIHDILSICRIYIVFYGQRYLSTERLCIAIMLLLATC